MRLVFFIVFRYFYSKKIIQSTSIILIITFSIFTMTSAAMFVVMSIFSGFRQLYFNEFIKINPDFQIEHKYYQYIPNLKKIYNELQINSNIKFISRIIEEKVYLINNNKSQVAILRGIDNNYKKIIYFDSLLYCGNFPNLISNNEIIISLDLFSYLNLSLDKKKILIYMPIKKAKNYINNIYDLFINYSVYVTGVLNKNVFNNIIITSIQNTQYLLQSTEFIANKLVLKIKNHKNLKHVKKQLQKLLGNHFLIKDRWEQDDSYIPIVNFEQLFTYLIFILIIILACFILASTIIVLIIEKTQDNKVLYAMGFSNLYIKKIYFFIGLFITLISSLCGIFFGLCIILIQINYPIITTSNGLPYPVKIELFNIFLVVITLIVFGILVSWLVSRKLSYNFVLLK